VKEGVRALGVAESYQADRSTLAGVVTRRSRVVDGFVFGTCTVGGTDATDEIVTLHQRLGREDLQYLLVAGVGLAWYNIVDLHQLHEETGLPVLSVSFEESEGLEPAIKEAFDGEATARRLEIYRSLPDRQEFSVGSERLFCRSVGIDSRDARRVVRAFTAEGGRPEPVRVARLAARAADQFLAVEP
jgi:endonuclease V-like protein UPF0215 family